MRTFHRFEDGQPVEAWRVEGEGGFTAPDGWIETTGRDVVVSAAPPCWIIRTLAWRRRLTDAEIGGITLAASGGMAQGDATLQVFLDDLGRATEVDLQDPHFVGGLYFVASVGLLQSERIPALLLPARLDERPDGVAP